MPNLVGIGLSQVPTNSMLGGLAYQDPEHASIKNLDLKNISQINSEIADTAVDVFIYDTSKDSDGGAWRKRTSHTSWYNETLGTATRGTRKEFPAVAVIVAETTKVTIYDGDDPDLPMWMVFTMSTSAVANYLSVTGQTISSISMLNGALCVGFPSVNGWGISHIKFITDSQNWYWASSFIFNSNSNIAGRNVESQYTQGESFGQLDNAQVADIAMTVLPNPPVDSATGLPVPTIAAATQRGVCIIENHTTVYNINDNTGIRPATQVLFRGDTLTWNNVGNGTIQNKWNIGSISGDAIGDAGGVWRYNPSVNGGDPTVENPTAFLYGNNRFIASDLNDEKKLFVGANTANGGSTGPQEGLSIIRDGIDKDSNYGPNTVTDSMVAHITASYNTGWQHGDIKGAFLSDTSTTSMPGSNIITNGDFSNGSTGWTVQSGWTVSSGTATCDGTNGAYIYQPNTGELPIGAAITVTVTITAYTSGTIRLGSTGIAPSTLHSGTGTYSTTFVTRSNAGSGVEIYSINFVGTIDNVIVTLAEEDRSVKNNPLQVFGTVTKTLVATGAELVAYGPFSNSNRLRQPYNSDLNFETNDFSVMFWMYNTGSTVHQTLIGRDNREFSVDILDNANYDRKFRIYSFNSSNALQLFDSNTDPVPLNTWSQICVNYTNGNTCSIYVNGVLNKTGTLNYDIDNTSNGLNIGARNTSGSYAYSADATKLALVRISKSAPSAEQVSKMYHDEKCLFQENAKATLYGSSDDMTALAFDEVTDQLHVGTSSGRSDFQGLCRINNTTTAVTTAISAHDEFIIEQ